jgi:DNA/RNA endonuclease YhcR with UshA esterase domain
MTDCIGCGKSAQRVHLATEDILRALVLILGLFLAAAPAVAQTIKPADARAHVGQTVTVEGVVSEVHVASGSGMTFIDMGGHYPANVFTAVIFRDDAGKFPNVAALNGKTVDVTGMIRLYKGKAEIILKTADQLKRR